MISCRILQPFMRQPLPVWIIPSNLSQLIEADKYGIWDDAQTLSPLTLSVMTGTVYRGRDIPLAWQIEFEPTGEEFELANKKLMRMGLDPDGYGWATLINSVFQKYHPEIAGELQFGDTDTSSCVVWVESEQSCRLLTEVVWNLIFS
jgi:hypothetical protein